MIEPMNRAKGRTETFSEGFTAHELKPDMWVAARRLHRTEGGTMVYEGLDRHGNSHKGTRAQILRVCDPYKRKADATGRANKGLADPDGKGQGQS